MLAIAHPLLLKPVAAPPPVAARQLSRGPGCGNAVEHPGQQPPDIDVQDNGSPAIGETDHGARPYSPLPRQGSQVLMLMEPCHRGW